MTKVFTIGSATMDVFVECHSANIVSVNSLDRKEEFMSYPYGSKIDMSGFSTNVGGGGLNTACNFANLGYDTSTILKIGDDIYAEGIIRHLNNSNINIDSVIQDKSLSTGFSVILVSFEGDRTVLTNRGANSCISFDDIKFDALKESDWLYVAPLNGKSNEIIQPLVEFAKANDIKICFNAGTTSLKQGFDKIKPILETSNVIVMNVEEASMCTGINVRPDTKTEHFSEKEIHPDIESMLRKLRVCDYQVVVITNGGKGAYAYDGKTVYVCPVFESDVVSTLGAGDAFASTFCAALQRTGLHVGKSLMYASVASASVVSEFSATEGLITFDEIEEQLKHAKNYTYIEV